MYSHIKLFTLALLSTFTLRGHTWTPPEGRNAEEIFTTVFQSNYWADAESISGAGSSLKATKPIRKQLPRIIKKFSISSMLDAPCGDFNWLRKVNLGNCFYIGADIVKPLIDKNIELYTQNKRVFIYVNVISDALPQVDLIFCRDLMIHFNFATIFETLKNFKKSGSRYLLMTTHPYNNVNKDINMGLWRGVNFEKAPFNFPKPLLYLQDKEGYEALDKYPTKFLGLWLIDDLPL